MFLFKHWKANDYFCFNQPYQMEILNDQMKVVT